MDWLTLVMQWLHLTAAVTGIGGVIYARAVVVPSLNEVDPGSRARLLARLVARARPLSFTVIGVLLLTGLFNVFLEIKGKPPIYHMLLTVKLLLAIHVFAVIFLVALPPGANPARDARRPRLMLGAAISGLVILLLSAYLRRGF